MSKKGHRPLSSGVKPALQPGKEDSPIPWELFEQFNKLDARARAPFLAQLGIAEESKDILGILTKSHFVIPGRTRWECQMCGECCRYARKVATFTYEPCPFLQTDNSCSKHDQRYQVCKWFPFWVYAHPRFGPLLTIKPYCTGYGSGPVVDYPATITRMLALARAKNDEEDGAFVIHEVLYLPGEHEWRFPSRRNVDQLLALMSKSAVNSAAAGASASGIEKPGELHYAHHYTSGLLGAIQDPQVTVDEKFRITDINDAFCSLCHSDRLALVARPLTDLFINPEAAAGALRGCFARGKLAGAPLKLRGTKGEGIPIIFNSLVFRDRADGLVHGALICVHPVPAMVFNEVTQSRQYARDLLEASLDALMVIDRAGVISDVNEAFCQLGGQPREKLIGSNFSDLFAPKEAAQVGVVTTYRDGTVRNYELDLLDSAGGRIPVSFNATVYRDQEGVSRGIFAAARDVREHKRMIMELEEAKNYARGLIESALDLMVTIDRSGKVMDVNAAAVRLTGRTREELVGSRFADYFDDPVRAKEGVDLTFSGGAVRDYRLNLITRNGKSVQVSFNATLYKDRLGQVQGVFATARESKAQTG